MEKVQISDTPQKFGSVVYPMSHQCVVVCFLIFVIGKYRGAKGMAVDHQCLSASQCKTVLPNGSFGHSQIKRSKTQRRPCNQDLFIPRSKGDRTFSND